MVTRREQIVAWNKEKRFGEHASSGPMNRTVYLASHLGSPTGISNLRSPKLDLCTPAPLYLSPPLMAILSSRLSGLGFDCSFLNTMMLGKTEGSRRRGPQRMRRLKASLAQWTWVWANSRRWWRTGKPGVLQSMGALQRVRHNLVTEQPQNTPHTFSLSDNPVGSTFKTYLKSVSSTPTVTSLTIAPDLDSCQPSQIISPHLLGLFPTQQPEGTIYNISQITSFLLSFFWLKTCNVAPIHSGKEPNVSQHLASRYLSDSFLTVCHHHNC